MRVVITGVTGFVGSSLALRLAALGHEVRGTSSGSREGLPPGTVALRLGDLADPALLAGVGAVIHAAHDLSPGARRRNVDGTIRIANAASAAGVPYQLYVSSYSAHPAAVTEYGLTKLELESYFLSSGLAVIRPGLVIGPGGLYGRIAAAVRRHAFIPVICPRSLVSVVGIDDLTLSVSSIIEQHRAGLIRLYLDERLTMWRLVRRIRQVLAARSVLVPVPYVVALAAVSVIETFKRDFPLRSDNVRGLRANQSVRDRADLTQFVAHPLGLAEMIEAAGS